MLEKFRMCGELPVIYPFDDKISQSVLEGIRADLLRRRLPSHPTRGVFTVFRHHLYHLLRDLR